MDSSNTFSARAVAGWLLALILLLTGCQARSAVAARPDPARAALPTARPTATRDDAAIQGGSRIATPTATPSPTPTAAQPYLAADPAPSPTLPVSAQVDHIFGYGQLQALSCESRSAADWARHFGITIHEMAFMARLPRTQNPETGFVGNVNGGWGNLPPDGYGVHAGPVAQALRGYGARAQAVRAMPFERLQAEIAADRPVMVWVTGHAMPGQGEDVQIDGQTVRVARYEHTVIVTGYDPKTVTLLDGKNVYQRPVETFLKAWSPLDNMAIIWDPALEPNGGPRE